MTSSPSATATAEAAAHAAAVALAEERLRHGEPLQAYDAAQSALQRWPGDVRLRQLQALALARSGAVESANQLLGALLQAGHDDGETLGMLARTHKDLALSGAPAQRHTHLAAAARLYAKAFETARRDPARAAAAYYAGINAATMAVLQGSLEPARGLAAEVQRICAAAAAADPGAADYWHTATCGEAALILGDAPAAAAHYRRAAQLAGSRFGDLSTTRRQARLLAAHLPAVDPACLAPLQLPPVVIYTGHMIDRPGRATPRFSPAAEGAVRDAVRAWLAARRPVAVYGSAACGADLLCLEAARELGCETHIVLPFPAEEFRRSSVDFADDERADDRRADASWSMRFAHALQAADSVVVASEHRARGSSAPFEYANLLLTGLGELRAQALDTDLRALAVCDPRSVGLPGGAATTAALWTDRGLAVEHVWPLPAPRADGGAHSSAAPGAPAAAAADAAEIPAGARHEIRALLFADAVGFSQLTEDQMTGFIGGFLEAVAALNRRTAHRCEHVETSGDGLYMVFRDVRDAGHYALELSALVRDFDRAAWGLPAGFGLRIAAHCGPVHCTRDPITGRPLYTGPHASRAARIEPITPPGQVYASSAFAAVAAATGAGGMALQYVGRTPLAKGYGTLGLYCVRAAG